MVSAAIATVLAQENAEAAHQHGRSVADPMRAKVPKLADRGAMGFGYRDASVVLLDGQFVLHVAHERRVLPDLVEPGLEVAPVARAVDFKVQLDVVPVRGQAERVENLVRGITAANHEVETLEDEIRDSLADDLASGRYSTSTGWWLSLGLLD